jgi:hypothetical protein
MCLGEIPTPDRAGRDPAQYRIRSPVFKLATLLQRRIGYLGRDLRHIEHVQHGSDRFPPSQKNVTIPS